MTRIAYPFYDSNLSSGSSELVLVSTPGFTKWSPRCPKSKKSRSRRGEVGNGMISIQIRPSTFGDLGLLDLLNSSSLLERPRLSRFLKIQVVVVIA